MRFWLSKIVPVRMSSLYSASDGFVHFSRWWQFRGWIFRLRDRATRCACL